MKIKKSQKKTRLGSKRESETKQEKKNIFTFVKKFRLFLFTLFLILIVAEYGYFSLNTNVEPKSFFALRGDLLNVSKIGNSYEVFRLETQVQKKLGEMTIDEKIGQMFMLSFTGTSVDENTTSLISDYEVANLVLMGQNVSYQQQLKDLTKALKELSDNNLLIATDQEGGAVARIPWDSARLISYKHIGIVNRDDFTYEAGENHAITLNEYDVDMNLAPVLDTLLDNGSPLYSRMFSGDPDVVASLGQQMIKVHQDNDVISTAKHFPGIGRTNQDTHTIMPQIDVSKEELQQTELIPFQAAINSNVEAIMVGHASYPQIDNRYPASLSKTFVTDILRDEMMFEGVVMTDDIHMGALNDYPDKVLDAVNAGNDIILIVDTYENQVSAINQLKKAIEEGDIEEPRIDESVRRILRMKFEYKQAKDD